MKRVLISGAAGKIATSFFEATKDRYEFRLTDVKYPDYETGSHEFIQFDLLKNDSYSILVDGIDSVVHLAGIPDPAASFEDVMKFNVLPTKHLLDACERSSVSRFVFASSAQVVEGYPVDRQVFSHDPVWPANFYGVGKVIGEALCAYYCHRGMLSTISVRIGAYELADAHNLGSARDLSAWLSPRDAVSLIESAINAEIESPCVVGGISNNRFKRLDISSAKSDLGYFPADDAFDVFRAEVSKIVG